jgi:hypothetical protein
MHYPNYKWHKILVWSSSLVSHIYKKKHRQNRQCREEFSGKKNKFVGAYSIAYTTSNSCRV